MSKEPQPLTQEQLKEFQGVLNNLLNPNGNNPQMDSYISSTFDYLLGALNKIDSADDKDKATDEVSKDVVNKLISWAQPFLDQWNAEQNNVESDVKENLQKTESGSDKS